jgi:hypothetical protein
MKRIWVLAVLSMGIPAQATTYTISAGASAATIQEIVNTASSGPGNTVMFSAGSYSLASTVRLPCSNGTVYTGPNVGVVTQANRPVAVLTNIVTTNYALEVNSNGTSFTGGQGCTIQYLCFSGTQGGIYIAHPASGIIIQYNYFTLNDPPVGGGQSRQAIYLDGYQNLGPDPSTGESYITIVWNVFYDNCRKINAEGGGNGNVDSGGYCAATMVMAFNNHLVWSNNTVNLVEEGLKLVEESSALQQTSLNADVENNNLQGNSRIMIESQQDTNGVGVYSHNAFYQPNNPNNGTFELSIPEWTPSISPTHIADDNVYIGNVPITGETGSGAHYGIGLELGGAGSIATNSLYQGGNGPQTCGAGQWCTGWGIMVGGSFTSATISGNYLSGTDAWHGTASDLTRAVNYEGSATKSNAGMVLSSNTVVQTSTTIPIAPPVISAANGSGGSTITISDSDTKHGLTFFYTNDGSVPAIFPPGGAAGSTHVYTKPFTVLGGTVVKAIASWGQGANQGIVFPSFGYVPSSVTTLGGASALARKTLVSAYLHGNGNVNTMVTGGTLQFSAYGVYSDGSVSLLPDSAGNAVTGWNTSNHAIAKVSTLGHVTAVGTGKVNVQAVIGTLKSSPWTLTVNGAPQPVAAAAAPAAPAAARVSQGVGAAVSAESASAGGGAGPAAAPEAAASAPTEPAPVAAPTDSAPAAAPDGSPAMPVAGPAPAAPGKAQPDAFLGPFWRIVSPAGGSASISNSHLFIGVPGGSNHDALLPSNQAVRVLQAIGNQNYDVAIKIDSPLFAGDANTSQGLMVLSDSRNFITFALETDGSKIGLSAHTVTGGVATTVLEDQDLSQYQNPMYLRLTRNNSSYVAFYSTDGISWTQAATFTDTKIMTGIGPFAGNHNDTPANAVPVVMSVNWFDVQQ